MLPLVGGAAAGALLATECSRPSATNAEMMNQMAVILLTMSLAKLCR